MTGQRIMLSTKKMTFLCRYKLPCRKKPQSDWKDTEQATPTRFPSHYPSLVRLGPPVNSIRANSDLTGLVRGWSNESSQFEAVEPCVARPVSGRADDIVAMGCLGLGGRLLGLGRLLRLWLLLLLGLSRAGGLGIAAVR